MLRADPSYPTVALFHVSLTLRKNLKRRAAESPTSRAPEHGLPPGPCFPEAPDGDAVADPAWRIAIG
ncbi:hypothetical protein EMIHUDRAFT_257071 [Emiliania huxleyi CCMP1516]|uniref:Uncharacterized protein n=2 Tax=Emiliania huxleyi TaxID=2903 RepID=A0A0D3IN98_EMIH1|nr:hypothetical protein EMIHUDRAFT_259050 [Emiliania huxleyi CCMP1516]XP_005765162.1 hypothetical protein EMIHUDRAFT_257071 [Emiliania huxleyi CCMP1516]EOD06213.1 hypothetical protein EMIHUDRAFT_259050 [Emiliania huxleyi CCMP1516]EOD12733.1 hypothetical protein EMIHUDRAFT_257071 [Emiliania huxleyi CCMP1516]|eukprot:XP_005758642.1 hypothetical protein EMIHUDRAFT_259050 [Emiliania huxleyi CCMP1516]